MWLTFGGEKFSYATMNIPPSSLFCKGGLSEEILPFKRKSYKAILFASQPSIISLVILRMAQQ